MTNPVTEADLRAAVDMCESSGWGGRGGGLNDSAGADVDVADAAALFATALEQDLPHPIRTDTLCAIVRVILDLPASLTPSTVKHLTAIAGASSTSTARAAHLLVNPKP
jgi:hypothetical protein